MEPGTIAANLIKMMGKAPIKTDNREFRVNINAKKDLDADLERD